MVVMPPTAAAPSAAADSKQQPDQGTQQQQQRNVLLQQQQYQRKKRKKRKGDEICGSDDSEDAEHDAGVPPEDQPCKAPPPRDVSLADSAAEAKKQESLKQLAGSSLLLFLQKEKKQKTAGATAPSGPPGPTETSAQHGMKAGASAAVLLPGPSSTGQAAPYATAAATYCDSSTFVSQSTVQAPPTTGASSPTTPGSIGPTTGASAQVAAFGTATGLAVGAAVAQVLDAAAAASAAAAAAAKEPSMEAGQARSRLLSDAASTTSTSSQVADTTRQPGLTAAPLPLSAAATLPAPAPTPSSPSAVPHRRASRVLSSSSVRIGNSTIPLFTAVPRDHRLWNEQGGYLQRHEELNIFDLTLNDVTIVAAQQGDTEHGDGMTVSTIMIRGKDASSSHKKTGLSNNFLRDLSRRFGLPYKSLSKSAMIQGLAQLKQRELGRAAVSRISPNVTTDILAKSSGPSDGTTTSTTAGPANQPLAADSPNTGVSNPEVPVAADAARMPEDSNSATSSGQNEAQNYEGSTQASTANVDGREAMRNAQGERTNDKSESDDSDRAVAHRLHTGGSGGGLLPAVSGQSQQPEQPVRRIACHRCVRRHGHHSCWCTLCGGDAGVPISTGRATSRCQNRSSLPALEVDESIWNHAACSQCVWQSTTSSRCPHGAVGMETYEDRYFSSLRQRHREALTHLAEAQAKTAEHEMMFNLLKRRRELQQMGFTEAEIDASLPFPTARGNTASASGTPSGGKAE